MEKLNFPEFQWGNRIDEQKKLIFDRVRKKNYPLTPEEWVRQNCLELLLNHYEINISKIAVERGLKVSGIAKRFDIVVFTDTILPKILVECKAPKVEITRNVVIQASQYNTKLDSEFIWLTNGHTHVWMQKNSEKKYGLIDFPGKI
jgi:type I site-specific restriction endonuclease